MDGGFALVREGRVNWIIIRLRFFHRGGGGYVLNIAHRGASGRFPENTLRAFGAGPKRAPICASSTCNRPATARWS